jgi:PBP1b-binding outer membrane lipoprotein LpoB
MHKLFVTVGLAVLLAGCEKAPKNDVEAYQAPADESAPITTINRDIPSMPKTPQTAVAPDERVGAKSEQDLQAAMQTPTNQSVISNNGESPANKPVPPPSNVGQDQPSEAE